jgi:hypothetical protein
MKKTRIALVLQSAVPPEAQNAEEQMKEDLTTLLQTVPFVPFTVNTRDGKAYAVITVGQMCVGDAICAYVDAEGSLLAIPFDNIDRVFVAETQPSG